MPDVFVDEDNGGGSAVSGAKTGVKSLVKKRHGVKEGGKHPREYAELMRTMARTTNPLSAFVVRPKKLKFETQDPQETILLVLRRHPITNLSWILLTILGLLAPAVTLVVPLIDFLPVKFQVMTVVVWYLLVVGYVIEQFLSWYFNVYVITDERIIDFDFYALIYKRVSETKIDRIEDVTFEMTGVWRSLFNYGTIFIQTAGESREFDFEDTPRPQTVVKFLNELQLEEEREALEGRVR
jgi:hypothetical protein